MRSSSIIFFFTLIILTLASSLACFKGTLEDFRKEALAAHNSFRAKHKSPSMILSPKLNTIAQNYAQYLANQNTLKHSKAKGLGENLYMSSGLKVDGSQPVKDWYNEVKNYPNSYGERAVDKATGTVGHFTQVVWKTSTILGCGVACSANKSVYVVCNYSPQGNFRMNGAGYSENVLPPK